jgi:hypothetical protein
VRDKKPQRHKGHKDQKNSLCSLCLCGFILYQLEVLVPESELLHEEVLVLESELDQLLVEEELVHKDSEPDKLRCLSCSSCSRCHLSRAIRSSSSRCSL